MTTSQRVVDLAESQAARMGMALIVSILCLSSSLLGCRQLPPETKGAVTILYIDTAYPSESTEMHHAIADAFMAKHPDIKIIFNTPALTYDALYQRTVRGAIAGVTADISFSSFFFAHPLIDRGIPVDLSRFVSGNRLVRVYPNDLLAAASARGSIYGVPFNISVPLIYYNVDLLKKNRIDPHALDSWDSIIQASRKLPDGAGPFVDYYYAAGNYLFFALVAARGGHIDHKDEKQILGGRQGTEALGVLRDLGRSGAIDFTRDQAIQSFEEGHTAMFLSTSSYAKSFGAATRDAFHLACAAFPLSEGGRYVAGGNVAMMLTHDSAKQDAAWEYIEFAVGPEGQAIVGQYTGYIPTTTLALENPDARAGMQGDECFRTALSEYSMVSAPPTFPGGNEQEIADVIRDELHEVFQSHLEPAAAQARMAHLIQPLISNPTLQKE